MPNFKINVGNVELLSLSDGFPDMSPLEAFPNSKMEEWREFPGLVHGNDQVTSRFGTTGLRSGGKLIIVDTGLQEADGNLIKDMRAKNVDPEAVDLVMFTHLHPDHVGWNMTNGKPTFPNARYLIPRKDWDYWTRPDVLKESEHITDQVLPLRDLNLMDLIDDGYKITDELTAVATPGHTPGHTSIAIASAGERGYVLGDVAHFFVQAHYTDWSPIWDVEPEVSKKTRHEVLDMLEAEGILVSAGHFPDPGFGHFVRGASRRVWQGI